MTGDDMSTLPDAFRAPVSHLPEPRLSVIVPAYGVAHLVGETLASLQAQTCPDWEAIVVDDGAPNDVEAALRPFADDPRIRFLKTDNGGVSVARNRAIAIARAPVLGMLDGDDLYEPAYVETMLAALEADPAIDFLTCDATYFGVDREGERFSAHHPQAGPITLARVLTRQFNIFIGCVIRRSAFDAVGGFDESLRAVEDLDLWLRLLATSHRGGVLPEALVRYRRRPGSLSSDSRKMMAAARRVYDKLIVLLATRPEQADAMRIASGLAAQQNWQDGEDLILAGEVREGLALLRGAERRSLRWQVAMPVMRLFPMLAKPMLKLRVAIPEPRRR